MKALRALKSIVSPSPARRKHKTHSSSSKPTQKSRPAFVHTETINDYGGVSRQFYDLNNLSADTISYSEGNSNPEPEHWHGENPFHKIEDLYVSPGYRGQGLAKEMVRLEVESSPSRRGNIDLTCTSTQQPNAPKIYHNLGFRHVEPEKAEEMKRRVENNETDFPATLDGAMTLRNNAARNYRRMSPRSTLISQRPRPLVLSDEEY